MDCEIKESSYDYTLDYKTMFNKTELSHNLGAPQSCDVLRTCKVYPHKNS